MHLLEGWFRRKFVRDGDGYRFREGEHEVRFSEAEVDAFIAQRRRVWSNPSIWAAYLSVGVALPLWLWSQGWGGEAAAIGAIAGIFMAVVLIHADRKPHEVAETRIAHDPNPRETDLPERGLQWSWIPLLLIWLPISYARLLDPKEPPASRLFLVSCWAVVAGVLLFKLYRHWRGRTRGGA